MATTVLAPAVKAYRTVRADLVHEVLFLRAEIAHLRHPNPLDTDHDAIKALGEGITHLQGRMVTLRKAATLVLRPKAAGPKLAVDNGATPAPRFVIKPQPPVLLTVTAPETGRVLAQVSSDKATPPAEATATRPSLETMAAALPAKPLAERTPYEIQQDRKARRSRKAPAAGTAPAAATGAAKPIPGADEACRALLARPEGATAAEIRAATGWKGPIMGGPQRAAKAAGKTLKFEGTGEARRFTLG